MRVRCVKLLDEQTGEQIEDSSWLSINSEYLVLGIYRRDEMQLKFHLIGDDGKTPAYHDANQFEMLTNTIPSTWQAEFLLDSHFKMGPQAWSKSGFWEAYFDGAPTAVQIVVSETQRMLEEEDN